MTYTGEGAFAFCEEYQEFFFFLLAFVYISMGEKKERGEVPSR
jgi:hypothetical protein